MNTIIENIISVVIIIGIIVVVYKIFTTKYGYVESGKIDKMSEE